MRAPVAAFALALLLAGAAAGLAGLGLDGNLSLLDGVQDDAGSGRDAPDACALAGSVAIGTHLQYRGLLLPPLDDSDDHLVLQGLQPGQGYLVVLDPSPSVPLNSQALPPDYDLAVRDARTCEPVPELSCQDRGGNLPDVCAFKAPAPEVVVHVSHRLFQTAAGAPTAALRGEAERGPGCVPYCVLDWLLDALPDTA